IGGPLAPLTYLLLNFENVYIGTVDAVGGGFPPIAYIRVTSEPPFLAGDSCRRRQARSSGSTKVSTGAVDGQFAAIELEKIPDIPAMTVFLRSFVSQ
ncbi:hypothetical protein, partial [Thalassospira mesophila]